MLALTAVQTSDPIEKARLARALRHAFDHAPARLGCEQEIAEPPGLPGRPAKPELLPHIRIRQRSVMTLDGRAALLHAVAHIELNAIDLALDVVWRFARMPEAFYRDWLQVADEEALHFTLLRDHLRTLGYDYGSFPAHNGLWEMAERTRHDILARLGLVPRCLEARGLDASPPVKRKLMSAGDQAGAAILDILLRDEIGHVAIGNHWYRWVCEQRGLDPETTFDALMTTYQAPRPRGPLNLEARRAAGFTDSELEAMTRP